MRLGARDLHVSRGGRPALQGVDLGVGSGELVGVIGPNGAGKSTLLKALAGLLPTRQGAVELDGRAISAWGQSGLARKIAYLPQERVVHWPLSVRSTVALGRFPYRGTGVGVAGDDEAVERALAAMDVAALAERTVSELSGGELARVLVARALAQETPYLLADEPAAGLDPAHQLTLFERLSRLAAEGRCVLVALHDLSLAARFCHKLLLLKAGRLLAEGAPSRVLTEPILAEAFSIRASLATAAGVPVVVPFATLE
jgi:iron complex transport system ATP-binding protein